jgi:hypothetical protein
MGVKEKRSRVWAVLNFGSSHIQGTETSSDGAKRPWIQVLSQHFSVSFHPVSQEKGLSAYAAAEVFRGQDPILTLASDRPSLTPLEKGGIDFLLARIQKRADNRGMIGNIAGQGLQGGNSHHGDFEAIGEPFGGDPRCSPRAGLARAILTS